MMPSQIVGRGVVGLLVLLTVLMVHPPSPLDADEIDEGVQKLKAMCAVIANTPGFLLNGQKALADTTIASYTQAHANAKADAQIAHREYNRVKGKGFKTAEWGPLEARIKKVFSDAEGLKAVNRDTIAKTRIEYDAVNAKIATEKDQTQLAALWKQKAALAAAITDAQRRVAEIDREAQAAAQPLFAEQAVLVAEAEKRIDAARKKWEAANKAESKAFERLGIAEAAKGEVYQCIEARRTELDSADDSSGSKGIDYGAIGKLEEERNKQDDKKSSGRREGQDQAGYGAPPASDPKGEPPALLGGTDSVSRRGPRVDHNELQNQLPPPPPRVRKPKLAPAASGDCPPGQHREGPGKPCH